MLCKMKRIITITLMLLIGVITYAQKPEGIGKFKINKSTVEIINDIEKEIGKPCEITNMIAFYSQSSTGVELEEILLDTTLCNNSRIFYLSEYTISDIKLKNIFLLFYKDNLVEFRCDKNKEIDILFSRKYGRPYVFDKIIPNCINSTLKYDEHITKFVWKSGTITTISFEKKQVFDGINREAGSYFVMYDSMYRKIINTCDIFKDDFENIKIEY